jgi:hypothetical protein
VAARAARQADVTARHLGESLPVAGQQLADTLAGAGQTVADSVSTTAHSGAHALAPYVVTAADRAGDLVERAQDLLDR